MKLKGVPGIEARISIDDEALAAEYPDPLTPDSTRRTTRYIEAQADAIFAIDVTYTDKFKHKTYDIKQQVWIDGHLRHDCFLHGKNIAAGGVRKTVKKPNRGGGRDLFRWKTLRVVDDDVADALNDEQSLALELAGLISVKLFRKELIEQVDVVPANDGDDEDAGEIKVPESKLKGRAIYMCVDVGAAEAPEAAKKKRGKWKQIDPDDNPCAEFKFQYRSRLALQELRVLPVDWARERVRKKAQKDREQRERRQRGVKRERASNDDGSGDESDDCVIDEEASTIVPINKAWIDVSTDSAPVVHVEDPGWLDHAAKMKEEVKVRIRGGQKRTSVARKRPKPKVSLAKKHDATPKTSARRGGHPKARPLEEESLFVTPGPESEVGGVDADADGHETERLSDKDDEEEEEEEEDEEDEESDDDESDDEENDEERQILSHDRDSADHYNPKIVEDKGDQDDKRSRLALEYGA